jgi:VWFA-related protein
LKLYAGLAFFVFLPAALAQSPAPAPTRDSPSAATTLTTRSTLVVVPALVRDKSGNLVFLLKADDFALTDDGIPQKLRMEEDAGGAPLALVVLIQAGAATRSAGWHPNATGPAPDRFRPLTSMMEAVTGDVPRRIAVVGFDSGPELLQDFTSDMDSITATIHDLDSNIDGDGGSAILDSLGFALDLLRRQPAEYRRAILLLSETNDRGSKLKLEEALRAVSDTNTAIYSLAYSTGNTNAAEYASRELPTKRKSVPCDRNDAICQSVQKMANSSDKSESLTAGILSGLFYGITLANPNPGPAHGCMSASDPTVYAAKNPAIRAFDCLGQLLPPLAVAKVAAIAATEDLQRNIPQTVAQLTGGEYFKLSDASSLEASLGTICNHMPNRYVLTFQAQAPHPGFHFLTLELPDHIDLKVSARDGYWADSPLPVTGTGDVPR